MKSKNINQMVFRRRKDAGKILEELYDEVF